MRRLFLLLIAFSFTLPAAAQVVRIRVDDTIQPVSAEYIARAIDYAAERHADVVLIELKTPGGLASSTRDIVSKILESKAPVILYVAPSGSNAASAGFYILESADLAAMAPGTNTGSAHPVTGAPVDDVMKMKIENDFAAFIRSYAAKRGRNAAVAETVVRQSKSFTDQEALDQHLIDVIARNDQDLLAQVNGRTIKRFDGSSAVIHTAGVSIVDYDRSVKERILGFLVDPNIAFLVLAIGVVSLYFEFNHPGAVIPGVVGVIFILLAGFALNLLPVRFAAVTLILASLPFFILEAKFATHGILGTGGVVLLTLGGLLLVDGPIPELRVRFATALSVAIPFGVITVFLMTIALRARRNKVVTGAQGMIGQSGVARSPLMPSGQVTILGEIWNAYSSIPVLAGEPIVVRGIDGLTLIVEPARQAVSPQEPALQR